MFHGSVAYCSFTARVSSLSPPQPATRIAEPISPAINPAGSQFGLEPAKDNVGRNRLERFSSGTTRGSVGPSYENPNRPPSIAYAVHFPATDSKPTRRFPLGDLGTVLKPAVGFEQLQGLVPDVTESLPRVSTQLD